MVWIDVFRGTAIICMVLYHLAFDLDYFMGWDLLSTWWVVSLGWYARIVFLGLVGVSLGVSREGLGLLNRDDVSERELVRWWSHKTKRGMYILGLGYVVSVVTWLIFGYEGYVRWGVLQMIGFSIICMSLLLRYFTRWWVYGWFSLGVFGLTLGLSGKCLTHGWLTWLGLPTCGSMAVDYFPLLPWLGMVSLGVSLGLFTRWVILIENTRIFTWGWLRWLGRKSLLIYVIHQPVLLAILYAVLWVLRRDI
jgi:uncharacterized membrane protein